MTLIYEPDLKIMNTYLLYRHTKMAFKSESTVNRQTDATERISTPHSRVLSFTLKVWDSTAGHGHMTSFHKISLSYKIPQQYCEVIELQNNLGTASDDAFVQQHVLDGKYSSSNITFNIKFLIKIKGNVI